MATANISAYPRGALNTLEYRCFFSNENGKILSAWHDIPLSAEPRSQKFNFVVECPKGSNAKMVVAMDEKMNPIRPCKTGDKPAFIPNIESIDGAYCNLGIFPQTWANPFLHDREIGRKYNNGILSGVEIGEKSRAVGDIVPVKILGVFCMLVEELECEWRFITIALDEPLAPKLNSMSDVDYHCKKLSQTFIEWLRCVYYVEGKPDIQFAFGNSPKERFFGHNVLEECHKAWSKLVKTNESDYELLNTTWLGLANHIPDDEAKDVADSAPEPAPPAPLPPDATKRINMKELK